MDYQYATTTNQINQQSTDWQFYITLIVFVILFAAIWIFFKKKRKLSNLERSNQLVFLRITCPREQKGDEDERKDYRELLAVVEPFLASFSSFYKKQSLVSSQEACSLEIIAKNREIFFYVGVNEEHLTLIEKQIHGQYPAAHIEVSTDYDLFSHQDVQVDQKTGSASIPAHHLAIEAAMLGLRRPNIFPIRTYKTIELDPLNAITNSLSKLEEGSAASIQVLIRPINPIFWERRMQRVMKDVQEGYGPKTGLSRFFRGVGTSVSKKPEYTNEKEEQRRLRLTPMQENQLKQLGEKSSKIAYETQIRVVTTAENPGLARMNLNNILSSYSQFNAPESNGFKIASYKKVSEIITDYLLREFGSGPKMILNTEEMASIFHFPNRNIDTPNIRWLTSRKLPPPSNLPEKGTIVGESIYRNETRPIRILPDDRRRHLYMIGKTGVGKTVLFENLILQDIKEGQGVCYIDPNGDAIEYILQRIPKERAEDVILFNPADLERPMGLNLLDWRRPEDKDFLVQESIAMFYKLFDPGKTGIVGPQFEHWMRNAALTLMSEPQGGTLIEIPRLFTDKEFEEEMVAKLQDPVVKSFWTQQMAKTSDYHKSEMLNYFVSKFGRFMTNDMMRNIIGQKASAFDFRQVMDEKKILLVNLSKGLIGDTNAQLLGMIIVTKLQVAAFSRQDILESERKPYYLYVDEFQNFTTDVFATILSEARKYALVLNITNQYIAQLPELIRDAVIGNAGTMIAWRIGALDAEYMIKEFEPLTVEDLVNVDKFNFYIKMLIDNTPTRPFNAHGLPPDQNGNSQLAEAIRQLSRLKYGRERAVIDQEIKARSRLDEIPMPGIDSSSARVGFN